MVRFDFQWGPWYIIANNSPLRQTTASFVAFVTTKPRQIALRYIYRAAAGGGATT